MVTPLRRLVLWCCCCICCGWILQPTPAPAQSVAAPDPGPVPKYVADPIGLLSNALGTFHRPISSKNAEAQQFFDQGFQMMYAFARLDAVRSFRESWKRDPTCAICYWGEAWAWGSYLNGPMPAEQVALRVLRAAEGDQPEECPGDAGENGTSSTP